MPVLTSGAVIAISVCVMVNVFLLAAIFDLQRRRRELLVRARCVTHIKYYSYKHCSTSIALSANTASIDLLMQACSAAACGIWTSATAVSDTFVASFKCIQLGFLVHAPFTVTFSKVAVLQHLTMKSHVPPLFVCLMNVYTGRQSSFSLSLWSLCTSWTSV
jgi:hypothetical protein